MKKKDEIIEVQNKKEVEVINPLQRLMPFVSFQYSYKSISLENGKTHIESREKRFTNGKLESEEFSGTLNENVYFRAADEMQKFFSSQLENFFRSASMLLPFKK